MVFHFSSRCLFLVVSVLIFAGSTFTAQAEEIRIGHRDLTLNAELSLGDGATLSDGVVLMVHGTLAHNTM